MNTLIDRKLIDDLNIRYECDAPLGPLTWYGVGGPAGLLAHPSSIQQLSMLAARCYEAGIKVYVLGSGANLLIADTGVQAGVVVQLDDPGFRQTKIDANALTAAAGCDLAKLVLQTARVGLSGLECLAGIPACLGGAIRMNAGGIFGNISQSLRKVQVMDATGHVYSRNRDDLVFSYRKTNIVARYILEAQFELTPQDPDQLIKRVKEIFFIKKNSQPLASRSAGCAFKNPDPTDTTKPSAGQLIDRAGLKGFCIGGAQVSTMHANFIVVNPQGTASDVLRLLDHVENTVAQQSGIILEREVVTWP